MMQEMILLDTVIESSGQQEKRSPLVVCRPQETHRQEAAFAPFEEPEDTLKPPPPAAEIRQPESDPVPKIERVADRRSTSGGLILRSAIALVLLSLTVWGYPKVCPTLDRICYSMLKITSAEEPVSQSMTQEEETVDDQTSCRETTATESEEVEEEVVTQSISTKEALVVGTIDNMSGNGVVQTKKLTASDDELHTALSYGMVKNLTDVSNKRLLELSKQPPAFTLEHTDAPQVLIMHTHATESYLSKESDSFDTDASFRTDDVSQNMIRIGNEIAAVLKEEGIGVLQDTTLHDAESYSGSYARSAKTVREYLEKYPTIRIVLDVHRDAIGTKERIIAPTAKIEGKNAAQIMIISGCDDGTMDMPQYEKNFRFAAALQSQTEKMYPGLTRPILFDYRKYNQDLTTGSLLIEVGSNANTLDQAVYSGRLFGNALAEVCKDLME